MRRRDFIAGVVGSTVALPLAAHAQQVTSTIRRVGVLLPEGSSSTSKLPNRSGSPCHRRCSPPPPRWSS